MCLTVKMTYTAPPVSIAKRDIAVYKKLRVKNNMSPIKDHRYRAGVLKKKVELRPDIIGRIEEGYHAYTSLRKAKGMLFNWDPKKPTYKIVKMIIPKGAGYYRGVRGDIVAEQLFTGTLEAVA